MIGLREFVTVRLEIDFEVLVGELDRLEQNALDHPLEKLITMWGDQITQANLMALLHRLESPGAAKNGKRQAGNL